MVRRRSKIVLKEADSGKLRQLSLSEELLKEDFVLNGMLFKTRKDWDLSIRSI